MTQIVLFHHAQGLTPGVEALADELRGADHAVRVPDLYEGRIFDDLEAGVGHAESTGFDTIIGRGAEAVADLPSDLVYVGISLGALPAAMLAQTRPGARGAVFLHSAIPPDSFAPQWPSGVPVQIHTSTTDDYGDADVAAQFQAAVPGTEVFLYDNGDHLFVDPSLPVHDAEAASEVRSRLLDFLARVG